MTIDLTGRAAVITGAGNGLGRSHALLLAARGASVLVNDYGGPVSGAEGDHGPADAVVAEIRAAGGIAAPNYADVSDPSQAVRIVEAAVAEFGRLDVVVNNAGILRDRTFAKSTLDDFRAVVEVHLLGSANVTHAAWPHLMDSGAGRVVFTTSLAGTSGNFGQSAYAAGKLGVVGLMNALAIEGRRHGILVNSVSPGASTRMTDGLNPPALDQYLKPELVSPVVAYLASETCDVTGQIIQAFAGGYSRIHYVESEGVQFDPREDVTPDAFAEVFDAVQDLDGARPTTPGTAARVEERLRSIGRWEA
ncbi:SDR family NAD(P)-dependent oxidoreductase [Aeromicrobium sp. CF4.19]|uniref:SDR family NAD(P)-dependent oxidoreductase n=1 Tax=Aeromicrobium sp. CF4.19 TaxID=3373082 RepID=UPI003EE5C64C